MDLFAKVPKYFRWKGDLITWKWIDCFKISSLWIMKKFQVLRTLILVISNFGNSFEESRNQSSIYFLLIWVWTAISLAEWKWETRNFFVNNIPHVTTHLESLTGIKFSNCILECLRYVLNFDSVSLSDKLLYNNTKDTRVIQCDTRFIHFSLNYW